MKIESKKLRLSKDKCAQIHVSKNKLAKCYSDLKVHGESMKKVNDGTYLGDIISQDGTIDKNIENRRQKGIGIFSQVTGMMNNISLGIFFYKISFTLRDAMLLNGILTNIEVWNHLKNKHVEILESVDLMLIRNIMNAHCMTAKEAFFLEAGLLPIEKVVVKRRLMYLWNIMARDDDELLKRFYLAQKLCKTKDDWAEVIEKDKKDYGIDLSDEEISSMKRNRFLKIVHEAVQRKALEDLNKVADSHSKSRNLMKANLDREKYLEDPRFSKSDVELLFSLRTRMIDVKSNFSNKYGDDVACRTCNVNVVIESQEHILNCDGLDDKLVKGKVDGDCAESLREQL